MSGKSVKIFTLVLVLIAFASVSFDGDSTVIVSLCMAELSLSSFAMREQT